MFVSIIYNSIDKIRFQIYEKDSDYQLEKIILKNVMALLEILKSEKKNNDAKLTTNR